MGTGDPNKRKSAASVRVRPTAPAGGGGPGHFRDADSFRADEKSWDTVRHSKAPAGRLEVAAAADAASGSAGAAKKRKAPKTKTFTKPMASQSTPAINLDVRVQVLADKMNDDTAESSADTVFETSAGLDNPQPASYKTMNGKITAFTKKLVIRGVYSIHTSYRPGSNPNDDSMYGRGTTPADKASGNVTLGFHESCHRDEFVEYLTTTPYPKFTGKVGMTEEEFGTAVDELTDAIKAFNAGLEALGDAVDEVGDCTKSDWKAGNCP